MGPDQLSADIPPPPVGFTSEVPPPPRGFDFGSVPSVPPPEGFDRESDPLNPPAGTAPQTSNTQVPGFWSAVGSAFGRGFTERVAADIAGGKAILPSGVGGKTLEEQHQEGLLHPETQDEMSKLLGQKVNEGWTDPKWWGAQVGHGAGAMAPGIGAAALGAPLGQVGAAVGFGLEGGLGTLVPAYKKARTEGLDPDAATTRALVDTGIAASTATSMGLSPGVAIFGRVQNPAVTDQVATMLKRPVMEMLAQLGVVQPLLADTGHIVTSLSHGEAPDPWDVATTHVVGTAMGGLPVGVHATIRAMNVAKRAAIPTEPIASPEVVSESFKNQLPPEVPPPPAGFTEVRPPETSNLPISEPLGLSALDEVLYPREGRESRIFYSKLKEVAEQKVPDNGTPEQVIATLKNNGVKDEEIVDTGLPSYLADVNGRVNKKDLLAHIEANGLVLEEARGGFDPGTVGNQTGGRFNFPERAPEYPNQLLPGEHSNYREFVLKTPARSEKTLSTDPNTPRGWQTAGDEGLKPQHNRTQDYTTSHWPEDINPIAHIRATDRIDRNGRNLLHIEEIQSDLHQEGRKKGYRDPNIRPLNEVEKDIRSQNAELRVLEDQYAGSLTQLQRLDLPEFQAWQQRRAPLSKEWIAAQINEDKLPDLPFKSDWEELAVKRILRLAADEGYDGISWANGDQVGLRQSSREQLQGSRQFYDKNIAGLFKKWAKKLGMESGETLLHGLHDDPLSETPDFVRSTLRQKHLEMGLTEVNPRNGFIEVNPAAGERIRQGLPLYEEGAKDKHTLSEALQRGKPAALAEPGRKIIQIIDQIGKDIKISRPLDITLEPSRATWRGKATLEGGQYKIRLNTNRLRTPEDLYATAGHELGHIILADKFTHADEVTKTQILEDFRKFRLAMGDADTVGDVRRVRDNAISEMTGARNVERQGVAQNDIPLSDLMPRSRAYLLHFEEWFAEQVAKWATTSEKPLSRVDKFYAALGKTIRGLIEKFNKVLGRNPEPTFVMKSWLDSMITDLAPFAADVVDKMEFDSKRRNADALSRDGTPEVASTPITASTLGGRNILDALPPDSSGAGRAMAAHADRMNKFYEWMTSLPQIAELNKHIRPLTMYKEIVATMNIEKNNIMSAAWETLNAWKQIRDPKQQFGLNKFIEDYMNGFFKDPSDTSGVVRRPTSKEFTDLVAKHKLSDSSLRVFNRLVKDFDGFLEGYRNLLLNEAQRIKDPDAQLRKIEDVNRRVDNLLQRPYFPSMRFGKYTITVYDQEGNVRHFEQTETLRKQAKIKEVLEKNADLLPGDRVRTGEVAKDVAPLAGMPPGMLDLMAEKLDLSTTQRAALDQLRFDYAPSQSFRHQFKTKEVTPGYSTDFQRAYANFFFHGSNHITRVKWVDTLRDQIRELKSGSVEMNDAVKRDRIANYMTEHLSMLVDPKPDFAALRGLMFHWYLGFNPASATLNLSQTPLMTYPHLASKFGGVGIGDARAFGALTRASTELNNFYKKGTLVEAGKPIGGVNAPAKARALAEAVKEGVISETQAHTLAAVSEGRNMLQAFGSKAEERWHNFSNASSWMFEMTEQYNRRVAFRAAWDLAMKDSNNKYVAETVRDNPLQYQRLRDQYWTHQEAAAFTAAKHSTEATQFVYAPYSRPKFMWGRKGALFIFKSFVQNTLFNLYNNPAGAARTLLILGGVGGLMGLPGMEDINGILKGLAWRIFGKDFDLEDEARKFAVDVLHGAISPDMLLHGTSVKGFGIPHVMHMMGVSNYPTFDRHGSIGMGNILPFEPGKLFGPSKNVKGNELAQLQRASGAGFSLGFALYNYLTGDLKDRKNIEKIIPRVLGNISHAQRYYSEGMEKNKAGNSVVRFDVNDTEHMAEILGRAMGYQPRRLIAAYEKIQAQQEAATYWDLRKGILLRQFGEAVKTKDDASKATVLQGIRNYNAELPADAKAKSITTDTIKQSVKARLGLAAKQEAGLPTSRQNYQMFKNMDKYYPEGRPTGLTGVVPVK